MRNANYPRKRARSGMNGNANFAARLSNAYLGLTSTVSQGAVVGILKMCPVVHKTNEMQWNMLSIRRVS
jgi:hypothetical protein